MTRRGAGGTETGRGNSADQYEHCERRPNPSHGEPPRPHSLLSRWNGKGTPQFCAGRVAQSAGAAAVVKVSCKTSTAKAKIVPGLYKLQTGPTAETAHRLKQKITAAGVVSGCTGGVTGGTFTSTENVLDPTNCNRLIDTKLPAAKPPTTGPFVIKWAGGKGTTTVGAAKLGTSKVKGIGNLNLTGKVTASTGAVAGLKGKTFSADLHFTAVPATGCISTNLVAATTKLLKPITIQ